MPGDPAAVALPAEGRGWGAAAPGAGGLSVF